MEHDSLTQQLKTAVMFPAVFGVHFEPPRHGWLPVVLTREGDEALELRCSHTPHDSIEELVHALLGVLETQRSGLARWSTEPDQYDFVFGAGADHGSVKFAVREIRRMARNKIVEQVVFEHEVAASELCATFHAALVRLEAGWDPPQWNWPFPSEAVKSLGALVNPPAPAED